MRLVSVKFVTPKPASSAPVAARADAKSTNEAPRRPVPVLTYPLLGAGIAGIAGFAIFAGIGKSKQSSLENSCEPHCSPSDLSPMKTEYLVGDVALGVGAAALIGAAIVYLTRPAEAGSSVPAISIGPGTGVEFDRRAPAWGASARVRW